MERTKESTAHSGCAFVHVGPAGWLRAVSSSSSLLPSLGPVTASRYCYYQERLLSLFCEYVFAAFIIFTDVVSATAMAPDPYIKRDKSNNIANIEEPSLSWQVNPRVVCSLLGLAAQDPESKCIRYTCHSQHGCCEGRAGGNIKGNEGRRAMADV